MGMSVMTTGARRSSTSLRSAAAARKQEGSLVLYFLV